MERARHGMRNRTPKHLAHSYLPSKRFASASAIAVVMDFAYESSIVCLTAKCWDASKSFLLANGRFTDILPELSGTLDGAEKFFISWYVFVSSFEKLLL
jgi:hypothetical protein